MNPPSILFHFYDSSRSNRCKWELPLLRKIIKMKWVICMVHGECIWLKRKKNCHPYYSPPSLPFVSTAPPRTILLLYCLILLRLILLLLCIILILRLLLLLHSLKYPIPETHSPSISLIPDAPRLSVMLVELVATVTDVVGAIGGALGGDRSILRFFSN